MKRGGFSIIEIIVTVTVLGILLTLAVVSMSSAQINARDTERQSDVESIALYFENYRKNNSVTELDNGMSFSGWTYPDDVIVSSPAYFKRVFPDIPASTVRAPGVKESEPMSLIMATNNNPTTYYVTPEPTISQYVYQPLTKDGALCYDLFILSGCAKFNIFYRLESDNSIQMISSKAQQ